MENPLSSLTTKLFKFITRFKIQFQFVAIY